MSFINYSAREINCKLVYYGPGLCGKTTNLRNIYERTAEVAKGKMTPAEALNATDREVREVFAKWKEQGDKTLTPSAKMVGRVHEALE